MEIVDYLRIARRRLAILIGVPLLAGALAVAYVMLSPRPYTATVYVSAPSLMGSQAGTYQGPQGATQFVNDFSAQATSPAVANAVARTAHVSADDVTNGVNVTQVNLSSQVELTYTTTDSKTAGPVALAVAQQSLTNLFAPQVHLATAGVDAATKSLHDANQALATFAKKNGNLPIDQQYATLTAQITRLEEEKALDESQGLSWSASVLSGKIAKLQSKAAKLAPLTGNRADLLARQQAAQNTLTDSERVLAQAQAQAAAAEPNQVVQPTPAQEVSLSHLVVTIVLPAAAVGLFLAIALVALLELVARQRLASARERDEDRHVVVDDQTVDEAKAPAPIRRLVASLTSQADNGRTSAREVGTAE